MSMHVGLKNEKLSNFQAEIGESTPQEIENACSVHVLGDFFFF